ncbi:Chymotrypsin-elastase inhibitor ixodidin [Hondaea fermentalgiana]|uniref:Chymotrypsin-elastase inhibitor ixodidin n=1 Tax=Hondaea fermentalgiana TaxID=2315210 RepID=A0A2R5GQS1_9STRA|nr:Chymotrypsin-elastase inhibitor ixodidin [Hondaea fermentalgiana]|eukprot:GBG32659.1 Chymotrypsin-elastase inhibitor ixodidin [Hondaea fermentalgiana]
MKMNLKRSAVAAVLVAAAVAQHAQASVVGKLPSCPDGMHTRFCWKDCEENVCGYTPDEDENCSEVPMVCADVMPKPSWTDEETRGFQLSFCRCNDVNEYFDPETLTCVASEDDCSTETSEKDTSDEEEEDDSADDVVSIGIIDDEEDGEEEEDRTCPHTSLVYKTCGSACTKTCGEPAPGKTCISSCVSGCFCKNPNRWYDPVKQKCVRKKRCTPRDQ